MIEGITVTIHDKVKTGERDSLNRPVTTETTYHVQNVLVHPLSEQEITDTMNLTGRKAVYKLLIPKGDTNTWTDRKVSFFGGDWRVIGSATEYIDSLVPLSWNKQVRVEQIDG